MGFNSGFKGLKPIKPGLFRKYLEEVDSWIYPAWKHKVLTLNTSQVALKGSTVTPTMRSATASDTMNKFVTERSLELMKTAAMTRQLPTITITSISSRTISEASCPGSSQTTRSHTASHSLRLITAAQDVSESPLFGITTCPYKLILHLIIYIVFRDVPLIFPLAFRTCK